MKKLVFLLALALGLSFQNTIYATTTDSTSVQITTAERIIDKYSGKIYDNINDIVSKLEGPAKEVFHYVTMKNFAQGIAGFLPAFLFIILFFPYWINVTKIFNGKYDGNMDDDSQATYVMGWGITLLVLGIITLFTFTDAIMHVIAPEWFAIQDIIGLVK